MEELHKRTQYLISVLQTLNGFMLFTLEEYRLVWILNNKNKAKWKSFDIKL